MTLPEPLSSIVLALAVPFGLAAQPYLVQEAESGGPNSTRLVVLRDGRGGLEAAVAPQRGGELSSLRVRFEERWIETLYLARDYSPREGWTGKAPFLWPAAGRNFPPDLEQRQKQGERFTEGAYELGGKRYKMPIHGFARELPWTLESAAASESGARAVLSLADNEETRKLYPFHFLASVEYTVSAGRLRMLYTIRSPAGNSEKMFFSAGNHITFNTPLIEGSDPREMLLTTPSSQEVLKTEYGIPNGELRPRSHAAGIRLGQFERLQAVSLTGYPEGAVYLVLGDPQGLSIRISHRASEMPPAPVVLFNIWGDAGGGFLSPEPWVGLQNSLVSKKGLIYLDPGEQFAWEITITPERE